MSTRSGISRPTGGRLMSFWNFSPVRVCLVTLSCCGKGLLLRHWGLVWFVDQLSFHSGSEPAVCRPRLSVMVVAVFCHDGIYAHALWVHCCLGRAYRYQSLLFCDFPWLGGYSQLKGGRWLDGPVMRGRFDTL